MSRLWMWILPGLMPCLVFAQVTGEPAVDRAIRVKSPKAADVYSEGRVALVIGNGTYAVGRLINPPNDAEDISKALQARKFAVTCVVNANKKQMRDAILEFGNQLKQGGIGVFYYAGHGAQRDGKNYLLPVGAEIATAQDVEDNTISVNQVLTVMESAGNRLNVLILDACRNNPFPAAIRGGDGSVGWAAMKAPSGTLIAYATAEGKTAAEGTGRNGVYTKHLLEQMAKPGIKTLDMFMEVRIGVKTDTRDQQTPFEYSSLTGNFYFTPVDFDDGRMALTEADLKRLRQLEAEQRAADKEKERIEVDARVKQAALDQEVAKLRAQLKVQSTSGTLDALASLAEQREQLDAQLREAERYAAQEKQKRESEIARLKTQAQTARKVQFETRYAKYAKAVGSKYLNDEEKLNAWKAICEEWQVAKPGPKPGELTWDEDNGCAIASVGGFAPRGSVGRTMTLDLGVGVKMEMGWIPAGEFDMGSNEYDGEKPIHRVKLTKGFWMGKYEVTQEQWERVTGKNPSSEKGAKNPVERVSWNDCQEFIKKLNEIVRDRGFRLPTEAEWEYACRAGTKTKFHSGDNDSDLSGAGWFSNNGESKTHPVGEKKANAFGLHDMHGNVWEWCQDWYGSYLSETVSDPTGPSSGSGRVLRGGSWGGIPVYCRSADRNYNAPTGTYDDVGFRVVCVR